MSRKKGIIIGISIAAVAVPIDMLQGRRPQSVLAQHYVYPSDNLKDEVLDALQQLKQAID
jgi:hypothetical protein